METKLNQAALETLLDTIAHKAFSVEARGCGFYVSFSSEVVSRNAEQRALSSAEKLLVSKGYKVAHVRPRIFVTLPTIQEDQNAS